MSPVIPKLLVIDPLTLLGRGVVDLLPRFPELGTDLQFVHTQDDEHQVAEVHGDPVLVAPLDGADQLYGSSAVIVATGADTPRLDHLETFLDRHPETPVVDMSRLERLWSRFSPAGDRGSDADRLHVRVPHTALVVAGEVLEPIRHLEPTALSVVTVDPVSTSGRETVQVLARQAATRLRGEQVQELIDEQVLAFNLVATHDELLAEDAARLFSDLPATITRVASGHFHGHLVHISLAFRHPVDEWELRDAWQSTPPLALSDLPLRLDQVVDAEQVIMAHTQMDVHRLTIAVVAMADGLLVGGAFTAMEVLRRLMVS